MYIVIWEKTNYRKLKDKQTLTLYKRSYRRTFKQKEKATYFLNSKLNKGYNAQLINL